MVERTLSSPWGVWSVTDYVEGETVSICAMMADQGKRAPCRDV